MFHKFNCVKQHDITDCGAACLATISRHYGYKTSIAKIREIAGTDKQGTNAYGVIKAAEQLGFSAKGVKGNKAAFFSGFPLPCIAHIIVDGNLLHYVVIYKIMKKQIISIGVIFLSLFRVLLGAIRSHLLLYLSQKLDISLLLDYYNHVLELPMNFFGTRKVGEIISRFNDASKVRDAISGATLTIMIDTLMAIAGGIILYMQNSTMFGITIIVVVLYFVIVFSFNKWHKQLNEKQMENNAQLTSYMIESLNGIQTVKSI